MNYQQLDDAELLHAALGAMRAERDADALVLLKSLVDRSPAHAQGQYLLAAQHAQMGLMDRAEEGFRLAAELAPEFPLARLQLGQLLLVQGRPEEAAVVLRAVGGDDPAVRAFAEGLSALAEGRDDQALVALRTGLELPQAIPELSADMRRLVAGISGEVQLEPILAESAASAPMLLSNYSRYN